MSGTAPVIAAADLTAVRAGHELDASSLSAYLSKKLAGFSGPLVVRQFSGGQSNPTYLLETGDRRCILRKKPPGRLLGSAHQVEREFHVMNSLRNSSVPVPEMLLLCEDDKVVGTPFFIMDYVDGRVFRDATLPDLEPAERKAIYGAMGDTLASLHTADWRGAGLADFGKPAHYIARQIARWARQYEASVTSRITAIDRLIAWLPANVPDDQSEAIAHGDYRIENLIFAHDEPKVLAVLDWELATIGHPLCDLAYNCMGYRLPVEMKALGGLQGLDLALHGLPSEAQYVAAYCASTGRLKIQQWDFYVAFSLFRCAAILHGVHARALENTAASANALEVGALAAPVAEIAWALVSDRP